MNLEIGNWKIEKAGKGNDLILPVKIIANNMQWDKENQKMTPKAFKDETVNWFIENGLIDWFHKSKKGKTDKEKSAAIIGTPTRFAWEKCDELGKTVHPAVYADLTRKNPFVQDIERNLEANQEVYGGSIGGAVLKARKVLEGNKQKEEITDMFWDHLAIAPKSSVVSSGTRVSLLKANNIFFEFSNYSQFESNQDLIKTPEKELIKAFENSEEMTSEDLRKALMVFPETDIAKKTGFTAMTRQSLEGGKYGELLKNVFSGLIDKSIGQSKKGIEIFMKAYGYNDNEINNFSQSFLEALQKIFKED